MGSDIFRPETDHVAFESRGPTKVSGLGGDNLMADPEVGSGLTPKGTGTAEALDAVLVGTLGSPFSAA